MRQTRYTKEFIDGSDYFSLGYFDEEYRKKLAYLGKTSGRDEDKINKAELTVKHENDIPYFEESDTVILCEKLSRHFISPEGILKEELLDKWYADENYHDMYVGKIIDVIKKK